MAVLPYGNVSNVGGGKHHAVYFFICTVDFCKWVEMLYDAHSILPLVPSSICVTVNNARCTKYCRIKQQLWSCMKCFGLKMAQTEGADVKRQVLFCSAEAAKDRAPCVIFIDEIDSVGAKRTNSVLHPYANQTINQLLSEMDGWVLDQNARFHMNQLLWNQNVIFLNIMSSWMVMGFDC